ncbi:MAG: hypothetical protein KI792_05425 [Alphaproteobacteria bacterium]|nr:hypothetical protein [Alphaproteobacteria bacterium SS10]
MIRSCVMVLVAAGFIAAVGQPNQSALAGDLGMNQTDTKSMLFDAFRSFESGASRDPITQQRIVACLAEQAQNSDSLSAYSSYDPNQWSQIDTKGLDLSSVVAGINDAIARCERLEG